MLCLKLSIQEQLQQKKCSVLSFPMKNKSLHYCLSAFKIPTEQLLFNVFAVI